MHNKFAQLKRPATIEPEKFSDRKRRMYSFLKANPVGVLSTVTPDGNPHGVVLYFAVTKDFHITFLTKTGTRKHDNLVHNGRVHLTVFEPKTQAVIQVSGHAKEVTESFKINEVAGSVLGATLKTSDTGLPPISKLDAGSYVAFDVIPYQIRMAVFARPDSGDYNALFESVESFELNDDY